MAKMKAQNDYSHHQMHKLETILMETENEMMKSTTICKGKLKFRVGQGDNVHQCSL